MWGTLHAQRHFLSENAAIMACIDTLSATLMMAFFMGFACINLTVWFYPAMVGTSANIGKKYC